MPCTAIKHDKIYLGDYSLQHYYITQKIDREFFASHIVNYGPSGYAWATSH